MIPAELLIAGAIFSGMAFAGNLVEEFNALHKDLNNMLSVFVTLSAPTSGGHTVYFDEENKLCKSVQFQHGQIQVEPFEKVLHTGEYWTGKNVCYPFISTSKPMNILRKILLKSTFNTNIECM